MRKLRKSAYTFILLATCLVASPVMISKIWKSSETKKPVNTPPVSDSSVPEPLTQPPAPAENPENPESPENPVEEIQPTTEATPVSGFVTSDLSYFDDALFIGDSRTVGIQEYGKFQNADFFCSVGMSSYRIDEEEIDGLTFDQKIDQKQYKKVYIMLGVNEVGNDIEVTRTSYRAVVEKVKVHQPDAIIYLQANLHVAWSAQTDVINNTAIDNLNGIIESLADNKRIFYVNVNEIYDDGYGNFTESYTSDGVHPLAPYYTQWCDWLCTKTIPIQTEEPASETIPE